MNKKISEKTLQDLEFNTVLQQVSEHCISNLGRKKVIEIKPITDRENLVSELNLVNEYLSSFENENRIPNHSFENIYVHVKRLAIENSFLETDAFLQVASVSETVNELLKFLKKFKTYYPTLFKISEDIEYTNEIITAIKKIITPYGEVADNASVILKQIRKKHGHFK